MYESQVSFTLDTVCPWTFIAKKRYAPVIILDKALAHVRSSSSPDITFTLHFEPFQLNPDLPQTIDRNEWYLENKHMGNPDAQRIFQAHMSGLAEPLGVDMRFDGLMGNTLDAHRVVQYFQDEKGAETAERLVDALYKRYFAEGKHPAADETLIEACIEAGIDRAEAEEVVTDHDKGARQVKARLREVGMDVDAVPTVVIEGKRRDITVTGAKEVADYIKALETVTKEST
ncbi:hypothetical protein PT974_11359 [Cladobotryum mycophilum]|uniref:DSBA-like thioredoxin domain-containing protein n=1 Tax=Cladobotryum mycophilum TaxID=491253 RepID=A0ABR0S4Z6_9HYPO